MSTLGGISGSGREDLASVVARGRRLVTVADVAEELDVDRVVAAKRLARWTEQGWLRRVRRGLYIPVPVDAEDPQSWSEDPLVLADAVWNPCYFSGWTAANHWNLTEQVFRTTILKTSSRVRGTHARLLDHEFNVLHVRAALLEWGMRSVWRGDRRVRLADPARTVVDILDDPRLGGGIRLCAEILIAYLSEYEGDTLVDYGDRLGNRAVFKRLGYLLDTAERSDDRLRAACHERASSGVVLLDPSAPKRGRRSKEWGVLVNIVVKPEQPA